MQSGVVSGALISLEEKREAVGHMLRSRALQRAPKLREFLRLICERALSPGDTEPLREQDIGTLVYQRVAGYNPAEDNIVRVEARNLRKKLADFFADEGKDLPIVITVPRGGYVPQFEYRVELATEVESTPVQEPEPLPPPAVSLPRVRRPLPFAAPAVITLLALLCAWLWWQNIRLRANNTPVASPPAIWSALFDDRHNTYLVLADSGFVVAQDILRKSLTLDSYLKRNHGAIFQATDPANERERAAEIVGLPQFTSVTGARFAGSIFALPGVPKSRLSIRFAREIEPRDLKSNHLILLGNARSNPWVELFFPKLNFRHEFDFKESRAVIRNTSPLPGESAVYRAGAPGDDSNDLYSTIAFLPNLDGSGNVLIVSGTGSVGTEAAGDLLFNPNLASQMVRELHLLQDGHLRFFEVLVRSSRLGSTSQGLQVVAHRMIGE